MRPLLLLIFAVLAGCATYVPSSRTPMDQVPMYGGMDRNSVAELKTADAKLIEGTAKEFGTTEKASSAFADRGFKLYQQNDLAGAMRRFNQAWILNPFNPEVFWGFASILQDQGKNCEAMGMMEKSLEFGRYISGLYPDAGRVITLCTVSDPTLTPEQKKERFKQSFLMLSST